MQQRLSAISIGALLALAASGCTTTLPGSGANPNGGAPTAQTSRDLANQTMNGLSSAAFFTQALAGVAMTGAVQTGESTAIASAYGDSLMAAAPLDISTLAGAVSVTVDGLSLEISVNELVVGNESLSALITVDGNDILAGNASASILVDYAGSAGEVHLEGLVLLQGASVELNASGTINIEGVNASFEAVDVVIGLGSCLPSGGTLHVQANGDSATLTFLPSTPVDGVATLEINGEVTPIVLEDPC